jgi:predicted Zn-dependent peptidase
VRGRSYQEPVGKAGIADLLHRMLPTGAGDWSREQLGRLIDRAGIELRVTDNPWIPYDDYYTAPDFSWIRLETVDGFYREAVALLAAMLLEPRLDEADFLEIQHEAMRLAVRREDDPAARSRELLREMQWPESPGGLPPLGTLKTLEAVDIGDLRTFHDSYFRPGRMVLAVVTGVEPRTVYEAIRDDLGGGAAQSGVGGITGGLGIESEAAVEFEPPPLTRDQQVHEESAGQEQAYIRMGRVMPVSAEDLPALQVAVGILSDRLAFELRERQGLAYSIGASLYPYDDRARLTAWMGTRWQQSGDAIESMTDFFGRFAEEVIEPEDVRMVTKSRIGRLRMRQVSRIGQAYALCIEELRGEQLGSTLTELDRQLEVEPDDVRRVARDYLAEGPLVRVLVR